MMKTSFIIFCILATTNAWAGYGGNIGQTDDRKYGSLQDPQYSAIAKFILNPKSACTAGFISENLLITNRHCAVHCMDNNKCKVHFWNGNKYVDSDISIVMTPQNHATLDGTDWAIFKSSIPNPNFKNIIQHTSTGMASRGGFGMLRIIPDEEIPILKRIYSETYEAHKEECHDKSNPIGCVNNYFNKNVKQHGLQPILEDNDNFKIQNCNIRGNHSKSDKMVTTDCDSAGGDSGAPLFRGNSIVALNNSGPQNIFNDTEIRGANALKTENFYSSAQNAIKQQSNISVPVQSTTPNKPNNGVTPTLDVTPPTRPISVVSTPGPGPNNEPSQSEPTVVTDPVQIQQIMQQTIMSMDCD